MNESNKNIILLHIIWDGCIDKFLVWGESQARLLDIFDDVGKNLDILNKKKNAEISEHPFSLSNPILDVLCANLSSLDFFNEFSLQEFTINLPSSPLRSNLSIPRVSPQLENLLNIYYQNDDQSSTASKLWYQFISKSHSSKAIKLRKYTINAIEIPTTYLIKKKKLSQVLENFKAENLFKVKDIQIQFVLGETFKFWEEATLFGVSLLLKNRYYPKIIQIDDQKIDKKDKYCPYIVQWGAKLSVNLSDVFYKLLHNLPPICLLPIKIGLNKPNQGNNVINEKNKSNNKLININKVEFLDPKRHFMNFLSSFIDEYIRNLFNSKESKISKDFIIEKLCVRGKLYRTAKEQRLLVKLTRSLFKKEKTTESLPSNIKERYERYISISSQDKDLDFERSFYTCLKIIAPNEDDGEWADDGDNDYTWKIELLIQGKEDPSIIIPAKKIWNENSSSLKYLKFNFENPQNQVLADLGKLRNKFGFIDLLLQDSCPSEIYLNVNDVYALIKNSNHLFKFEGIKILLPKEITQNSSKLGLLLDINSNQDGQNLIEESGKKEEISPKALNFNSGLLGFNSIVQYQWKIALGDQVLSQKEFKELTKLKVPLLKIRGNWVELSPSNLEKIQNFFKKLKLNEKNNYNGQKINKKQSLNDWNKNERATVSQILKKQAFMDREFKDIPVMCIKGDKEFNYFFKRFNERSNLKKYPRIKCFNGKLRPYQSIGVSWLRFMTDFGIGACLADDMGLGKTIQIIALLLDDKQRLLLNNSNSLESHFTALIICPMSILGNWKREINRFAPDLNVFIHHGTKRIQSVPSLKEKDNISNKGEQISIKYDVVLTTYSLAHKDEYIFKEQRWKYLILDEAQNIKNFRAKRTLSIKKFKADNRIALTGTPIENRLSELWSILDFLNPNYLGSISSFSKNFIKPIERYRDKEQKDVLKKLVNPFLLRRLKSDKKIIKDLPKKREMDIFCNLTKEQATLYEAVVQDMIQKIENSDGIQRKGLILSSILKLKQVCNHPSQFLHSEGKLKKRSGKLMRLFEMISEAISEGDKVLVFTQFKEMGKYLQKFLGNQMQVEIPFLHGGVSQKNRDLMIKKFQSPNDHFHQQYPIFIVSLKAGGTGLNLTAANHVFHYDRWWNPAVENQATDRAYRIGQRKDVNVYKFICIGTIEEQINEIIGKKKKLAEDIIGSGENWITELTNDELKRLFTLNRQEAVI